TAATSDVCGRIRALCDRIRPQTLSTGELEGVEEGHGGGLVVDGLAGVDQLVEALAVGVDPAPQGGAAPLLAERRRVLDALATGQLDRAGVAEAGALGQVGHGAVDVDLD